MATVIDKGIISTFEEEKDSNGNLIKARVLPSVAQSMPTRPLVIVWHLRGEMGNLKAGDEVWFALANDLTGIILERVDGEWGSVIPGNVETTGNLKAQDVTTSAISSINSHVHSNGNQGGNTGAPVG